MKWDLGAIPDASQNCESQGGDDETQSYIWIADSGQSTVSKIDTQTMIEVARYYTRDTPGTHRGPRSRSRAMRPWPIAAVASYTYSDMTGFALSAAGVPSN